ncbi:phosphoribosylglycinamide formyltransferase [Candidatus Gracilibacteria bacterium]|nr:phosphoribosylglycinamide formyltransferase [Candidatus Gracilibacteria bacterium]NJM87380.1 phosphoribosylglycinamide formyltransferase [Hydrococcus sp. RU_2_2]NJP19049.1 phosphoribosylglycinamide formyltransferase [Hydrococcus sp. CRU_1_1]NJQ98538.1 phosphoribosylglycinamide formyltransferase [Hydrococcus sp. CSU_1_8]
MTVQIDRDRNYSTLSLVSPIPPPEDIRLDRAIRLGVMASGSGTNFEALAQAIDNRELNAQIPVLIYNNPEAKVKEKAKKWNVPAILLDHRIYKRREDLDRVIIEVFQQNQVEWIVMAGWMRIITSVLLDAFPNRVINIHPSLLPSFKGVRAIEQALESKVKITGCTVHLASLEVDSGPIIMQAAVPILPNDTPETLHARIQIQEHKIFPIAIALAAKQFGFQ